MFTWCNHREGKNCISERLDRFHANHQWCAEFPKARVIHGSVAYSDHLPIWIELEGENIKKRPKLFRFETMWVGEKGCDDIVKEIRRRVDSKNDMEDIMNKLFECGQRLDRWNQAQFGRMHVNLRNAQQRLQVMQDSDLKFADKEGHVAARKEVKLWLERGFNVASEI